MSEKKTSLLKQMFIACVAMFILGIVALGGCAALVGSAANEIAKEEKAKVQRIEAAPISNIQWEEIDNIYNLRSKFTELQKKEHWKHYEGQKVQWKGKVSSIGETFGTLTIQVKLNPKSFTSDVLVRLKDTQRDKALSLKKDDIITFTGVLDDWGTLLPVTLDHGQLN